MGSCCCKSLRVRDGSAFDESSPLDPGNVDSRHFDIQRTLGEGGFGKVNAVIKKCGPDSGKWYAMKALVKEVIVRKKMHEEVMRELSLLCELGGSHFVCNAHYAFQDSANLYLVLDLYLGGDLPYNFFPFLPFPNLNFDQYQRTFPIASAMYIPSDQYGTSKTSDKYWLRNMPVGSVLNTASFTLSN